METPNRIRFYRGPELYSRAVRGLALVSAFLVFLFVVSGFRGTSSSSTVRVEDVVVGDEMADFLRDWQSMSASGSAYPATLSQATETDTNRRKRKAIISSTWGNTTQNAWISELLPDWSSVSYDVDDFEKNGNSSLRSMNGMESSVYLSYIIDHYDSLPDYMVFIHGSRYQFHNDEPMYDTYPLIANLSLEYVEAQNYTSLRCEKTQGCGHLEMHPLAPGWKGAFDWSKLYQETHAGFFPGEDIPETVRTPCCSQFAVTRAAVRATPLALWQQRREWLWNKEVTGSETRFSLGAVMEWIWHQCFGKPPVNCGHDIQDCYCEMWGACGLECKELECKGRYWGNPLMFTHAQGGPHKLPKNWPDKEVQGTMGMPYDRWWEHLDENWEYHPNDTDLHETPSGPASSNGT